MQTVCKIIFIVFVHPKTLQPPLARSSIHTMFAVLVLFVSFSLAQASHLPLLSSHPVNSTTIIFPCLDDSACNPGVSHCESGTCTCNWYCYQTDFLCHCYLIGGLAIFGLVIFFGGLAFCIRMCCCPKPTAAHSNTIVMVSRPNGRRAPGRAAPPPPYDAVVKTIY